LGEESERKDGLKESSTPGRRFSDARLDEQSQSSQQTQQSEGGGTLKNARKDKKGLTKRIAEGESVTKVNKKQKRQERKKNRRKLAST